MPPGFLAIRSFHLGGIRGRGGHTAPNPWHRVQHTVFYLGAWNQNPALRRSLAQTQDLWRPCRERKYTGYMSYLSGCNHFSHSRNCEKTKEKDKEKWGRAFPGGPVVKNLPSNAGDEGLIPGGELRSHKPQGN